MTAENYTKLLAQLIAVARRDEMTNVRDIYAFVDHETVPVMPIGHSDSTVEGVILGLARTHESTGYVFFSPRPSEEPATQNIAVVEMWERFEPERIALLHDDVESTDAVHPDFAIWDVYDNYVAELDDDPSPKSSDATAETAENDLSELFG